MPSSIQVLGNVGPEFQEILSPEALPENSSQAAGS